MDTRETIVIAKQETMRQMGLAIADEQTCAETIGLSAKIGFKKNKLNDNGIVCTIATSRSGKSLREFLDKMNITNLDLRHKD